MRRGQTGQYEVAPDRQEMVRVVQLGRLNLRASRKYEIILSMKCITGHT
jgi:hypothetical protein